MVWPNLLARFHHRSPEQRTCVEFDEAEIRYLGADGRLDTVRWDELRSLAIETNDGGPFVEDVYLHLVGRESSFYVPQAAQGFDDLVGRLFELPRFDCKSFARAMGSTANAYFPCWDNLDGE